MVEQMEGAIFVPAHAEVTNDIKELVQYNRQKVLEIAEQILDICQEPVNFETILQQHIILKQTLNFSTVM